MKTLHAPFVAVASLLPSTLAAEYEPTWESTDKHNASPEWFRDAKFGVYWHWGAFTTPQYGSEWYGRDMYGSGNVRDEHTRRYGPPEEWGYENFIVGDDDLEGNFVQFRPVLSSDGGEFDPASWMELVEASGAKFAGPVAEHHDGYSMWESEVNEWNSVAYGPKLDLVKMWEGLVREKGLKYLIAMHQAFNTNGFFEFAPQQNDTTHKKLYGQLPKDESDQLWLNKAVEVLDHVQPDVIWNDFSLDSPGYCQNSNSPCNIGETQRLEFLAHYFNRGVEWGQEVLTTYKHFDSGFRDTSAVSDFERGGPADIVRPFWLTDDAISASSWSYTVGMPLYNSVQMIHSMLDRISKNGNMLLNISPTAVGVIPDEQQQVLRDIGAYLSRYGESVYETRAWDIYGEGPNRAGGGSFTAPLTGNSSDIRFTRNKDKSVLYATILGWPEDSSVSITSLGSEAGVDLSDLTSVQLLGDSAGSYSDITDWDQSQDELTINLPSQPAESQAYVLKLSFSSNIPVPQIKGGASAFTSDSVKGAGISLPQGDFKSAFFEDEGTVPGDVTLLRVADGATATVYSNGDLTGDSKTYESGEHTIEKGSLGSVKVEGA